MLRKLFLKKTLIDFNSIIIWITKISRLHTILVVRAFSGANRRSQNSRIIFILSVISVAPSPSPNTSKTEQKNNVAKMKQQKRKPSLNNLHKMKKDYNLAQMLDQMLGTQFPVKGFPWITKNNSVSQIHFKTTIAKLTINDFSSFIANSTASLACIFQTKYIIQ